MAAERSLYSPSWYRVADLRPRLRSHVRIYRQHFRGQLWYVLQDRSSGRFHRFTPAAYLVINLMDGRRTVQQIWDSACSELGDDVLTQDEVIRLLAQLHQSDVLQGNVAPDTREAADRAGKQRRRKLIMSLLNPMAIRLPLLDPDDFLTATMPLVRPFIGWFGAILFLIVTGYGLVLAGLHWAELTENIAGRILAAESLLLLAVTYPIVKALHELGHGYAIKRWGGEVHEMGVMFLVFMPVPYVDGSATAAFRTKWRRAFVGAAGIIVEMLLAAVALIIWVDAEEGLVRAFAYNVILIGGVSTLLFNGNPLLRFDGYHVLSDLLEIPNLGNRANRYIGYLLQRYLFGVVDAVSPATARGEPGWFISYGIASFIYRIFIMFTIVLFVASKFFIIGVFLAIWGCVMMIGVPLAKQTWFLLTSPVLRRRRGQALGVCAGAIAVVAGGLMFVPLPYATVSEGVVWVPGEAMLHAGADGFAVEVLSEPDRRVAQGDPLVLLHDPLLDAQVRVLDAKAEELRVRLDTAKVQDPAEADIIEEQLERAVADLGLFRQRQQDLLIRSPRDGRFVLPRAEDVVGLFFRRGDVVGYVVTFDTPVVRVIVPEASADLVRQRSRAVELRLVNRMDEIYPATIHREVPVISEKLPSLALSTFGGGAIHMDPTDPQNLKTLEKVLQLEIRLNTPIKVPAMGGRTYVRFDHGSEPLAWRLYRSVRQLFLGRFHV